MVLRPCTGHECPKEGPLIPAMLHNQTCNCLCQLPDGLLLDIMKRLDLQNPDGLRRLCRLLHSTHPSLEPRVEEEPAALSTKNHEYCAGCLKMRTPEMERSSRRLLADYLHCAACGVDHPMSFFSIRQRTRPLESRICIGREGFIRICEHRFLKWADVEPLVFGLKQLDTGSDTPARVTLMQCKSCSHISEHHGTNIPPHNQDDIYPTVTLEGSSRSPLILEISWTGHLPIFDNTLAAATLRSQFDRFRSESGVAQYIAPELPLGDLPEMNCSGPGPDSPLTQDQGLQCLQYYAYSTCDFDSARGLFFGDGTKELSTGGYKRTIPTTGKVSDGTGHLEISVDRCPRDQCLQVHYRRKIGLMPGKKPALANCLPWAWYQAVEPDSYNLTDDKESLHVLWCRKRGCKNYYRYLKQSPDFTHGVNRCRPKFYPKQDAKKNFIANPVYIM
ncbi:hypothetical protein F4779DRAFT_642310 [Xylariaceae sp. FL0662B]|nr:hypothetical protein F4779DRAFT_642310 [Xylariaceae sp. FL0662B]